MRLLVTGGRDFTDAKFVNEALDTLSVRHRVDVLIHGDASGADRLADNWARAAGIPRLPFPADWVLHGPRAGNRRNFLMLEEGEPEMVLAFPGHAGTADMITKARDRGIPVILAAHLVRRVA